MLKQPHCYLFSKVSAKYKLTLAKNGLRKSVARISVANYS